MAGFPFFEALNDNVEKVAPVIIDFNAKRAFYDCPRQQRINDFFELLIDYRDALYFPRTEKEQWQITYAFAERLTDMCDES